MNLVLIQLKSGFNAEYRRACAESRRGDEYNMFFFAVLCVFSAYLCV
jgi:hypothetical protein